MTNDLFGLFIQLSLLALFLIIILLEVFKWIISNHIQSSLLKEGIDIDISWRNRKKILFFEIGLDQKALKGKKDKTAIFGLNILIYIADLGYLLFLFNLFLIILVYMS